MRWRLTNLGCVFPGNDTEGETGQEREPGDEELKGRSCSRRQDPIIQIFPSGLGVESLQDKGKYTI